MPWTGKADVTLEKRQAALDNSPLIMDLNKVADLNVEAEWNTAGTWAGSDITSALLPTSNLYGGQLHLGTQPTSATGSVFCVLDLDNVTFDSLFLKFNVLGTGVYTISILIDDNNLFDDGGGERELIAQFVGVTAAATPATPTRLVQLKLGALANAQVYTGVRYVRIEVSKDGGGAHVSLPRIGQFFLGLRNQFPFNFSRPMDRFKYGIDMSRYAARSLARQTIVHARGHRDVSGTMTVGDEDGGMLYSAATDVETMVRNIYENSKGQAIVYIQEPTANPDVALFGLLIDELNLPQTDVHEHPWNMEFVELPPFRNNEG